MEGAPIWRDPRVVAGMSEQLERRRQALDSGERAVGWKLGFGTEQAMANLGTSGPLAGYLTDATAIDPGGSCAIGGWTKPLFEAEIGIHLGADVPGGTAPAEAVEAIEALGPAIELADLDQPPSPQRVRGALATDLYHRAYVLAPPDARRPGGDVDGLSVRVTDAAGAVRGETDDPEAVLGAIGGLVAHLAGYLAAFDLELEAGQTIISGATVPLIDVEPGELLRHRLDPIGELEVSLAE